MEPISIPDEVAAAALVPADLDSGQMGPYRFPEPRRRRVGAVIYGVLAGAVAVLVGAAALPGSGYFLAAGLALLAGWHLLSAWPLSVGPEQALTLAAAAAPFPIGHSSAAVTFHGFRARPRWHVILYDAGNPPTQRALVVIDAVTGVQVGDTYLESVPESQ